MCNNINILIKNKESYCLLISNCQSEKYGNLKVKIYFEKHSENLQKLNVSFL
jgi:hypothetical protein